MSSAESDPLTYQNVADYTYDGCNALVQMTYESSIDNPEIIAIEIKASEDQKAVWELGRDFLAELVDPQAHEPATPRHEIDGSIKRQFGSDVLELRLLQPESDQMVITVCAAGIRAFLRHSYQHVSREQAAEITGLQMDYAIQEICGEAQHPDYIPPF